MKRLMWKHLPRARAVKTLGIQPCVGLNTMTGIFCGCDGRQWNLADEKRLRPKAAALDPRMNVKPTKILSLVRAGELYPVFRLNSRVIEIYACALEDWWARQLRRGSNSKWPASHNFPP